MTRELLPQRRHGETFEFRHGPLVYTATIGRYQDGRIGELFLRSGKSGTDASLSAIETAIAVSFALQHGATIEQLRTAMPRTTAGTAEGVMGTLLDLLAEAERK